MWSTCPAARAGGRPASFLALSASVGVEREVRQKNAGLRTHSLVGLGAALLAIGAAAAGLRALAIEATAAYFIVAMAFPALARRLPRAPTASSALLIRYPDGHGILRRLLQTTTAQGFTARPRRRPGHRRRNA
jgi:uncharacterized membrane protein YhiD involved in acid resistance